MNSITPIRMKEDRIRYRIEGACQLMNISVTPQELFYMTSMEPEIYIGIENHNFIQNEHVNLHNNQLHMEVINMLLNRIMLYGTSAFTFQDEVYITAVLRQLGVYDVRSFMRYFREERIQNEQMAELLKQYYIRGQKLLTYMESTIPEYHKYQAESQKENQEALWLTIFTRLKTAECNNAIYEYQHVSENVTQQNSWEFQSLRQIQQADAVQLAQIKQYVFGPAASSLPAEKNHYERKQITEVLLLGEQITEAYVMGQLAAAMLLHIVKQLDYRNRMEDQTGGWIFQNLTRILYRSTDEVKARFEWFENKEFYRTEEIERCIQEQRELEKEEFRLLEMIFKSEKENGENKLLEGENRRKAVYILLENQNVQNQIFVTEQLLERFSRKEFIQKDVRIDNSLLTELQEKRRKLEVFRNEYVWSSEAILRTFLLDQQFIPDKADEKNGVGWQEKIEESAEMAEMMETAETVFSTEDEFIQYLEKVNEKNQEFYQRYINTETQEAKQRTITVERESAVRTALRALEDPEAALREIYEKGTPVQSGQTEEVERYLSLTDEKTQKFYRELLSGVQSIGQKEQNQDFKKERIHSETNQKDEVHIPKAEEITMEEVETFFLQADQKSHTERFLLEQWKNQAMIGEVLEQLLVRYREKGIEKIEEKIKENIEETVEMQKTITTVPEDIEYLLEQISKNQAKIVQQFYEKNISKHIRFYQKIEAVLKKYEETLTKRIREAQHSAGMEEKRRTVGILRKTEKIQREYLQKIQQADKIYTDEMTEKSGYYAEIPSNITQIQRQYTEQLTQLMMESRKEEFPESKVQPENDVLYEHGSELDHKILRLEQADFLKDNLLNQIKEDSVKSSLFFSEGFQKWREIIPEKQHPQMSLTHSQNRPVYSVEEEVMENLRKERTNTTNLHTSTTETYQENRRENVVIENQSLITENVTRPAGEMRSSLWTDNKKESIGEDEILQMIERNTQRQIKDISDEVYQRLERRLAAERRRRGQ